MMNESIVSALLQASITGAGLVLAIYALIVPIAGRIFQHKSEALQKSLDDLKQVTRPILEHKGNEKPFRRVVISEKDAQSLENVAKQIKARISFPDYLRLGVGASFILYTASSLACLWWLMDWERVETAAWIPRLFGLSTFVFLVVGICAIRDIYYVLKKDFESFKQLKSSVEGISAQ